MFFVHGKKFEEIHEAWNWAEQLNEDYIEIINDFGKKIIGKRILGDLFWRRENGKSRPITYGFDYRR